MRLISKQYRVVRGRRQKYYRIQCREVREYINEVGNLWWKAQIPTHRERIITAHRDVQMGWYESEEGSEERAGMLYFPEFGAAHSIYYKGTKEEAEALVAILAKDEQTDNSYEGDWQP